MILSEMRLEVIAGEGVVAHIGSCVLFVAANAGEENTKQLLDIVRSAADIDVPGRQVARQLAGWLAQLPPDEAPPFGAVAEAHKGLAVVLHGAVHLRAIGPGLDLDLDGSNRPTWVDDYVSGDAVQIWMQATGADEPSWSGPFHLAEGVVPGSGCMLALRHEVAPAPSKVDQPAEPEEEPAVEPTAVDDLVVEEPAVDEPVAEPAPSSSADAEPEVLPFDVIDLSVVEDFSFTPLPVAGSDTQTDVGDDDLVEGKACIKGHFNDLVARYCSLCGIGMVQVTEQIVLGKRPPLGLLVFEDGMTFSLDSEYVVGREPDGDAAVQDGHARPIEIVDSDIISRVHARIRLAGWEVEVVDEGSSNGTFVREGDQWRRLKPGDPQKLLSGTEVRLGVEEGARVFTFDSHHRPR